MALLEVPPDSISPDPITHSGLMDVEQPWVYREQGRSDSQLDPWSTAQMGYASYASDLTQASRRDRSSIDSTSPPSSSSDTLQTISPRLISNASEWKKKVITPPDSPCDTVLIPDQCNDTILSTSKPRARIGRTRHRKSEFNPLAIPTVHDSCEDEDDPHKEDGVERRGRIWGMKVEAYRALPARDRKRVRNKISARAFRAKRKQQVISLETDMHDNGIKIKLAEEEISSLRQQVVDLTERLAQYEVEGKFDAKNPIEGGEIEGSQGDYV